MSARVPRVAIRGSSAAGIPGPSSSTVSCVASGGFARALTRTRPRAHFAALSSRLPTTSIRSPSSPASRRSSGTSTWKLIARAACTLATEATTRLRAALDALG